MKEDQTFLGHILESIEAIESYTFKVSKVRFLKDFKMQDAVIRRFQIIGEATKHLSETFRSRNADVQWKQVAGMRDVLIHEYFGIDLNFVWHAVKHDMPRFKRQILKMIK